MTDLARLRQLIKGKGLLLSYVAKEIGISKQSMSLKINGYREFTAAEIGRLCDVLQITRLSDKESIFFAKDVAKNASKE